MPDVFGARNAFLKNLGLVTLDHADNLGGCARARGVNSSGCDLNGSSTRRSGSALLGTAGEAYGSRADARKLYAT